MAQNDTEANLEENDVIGPLDEKRWKITRTYTIGSDISSRSLFRSPVQIIRNKFYSSSRRNLVEVPASQNTEQASREKFILYLTDNEGTKGTKADASKWYITYLESKFELSWEKLQSNLNGLGEGCRLSSESDKAVVYRALIFVAKMLRNTGDLQLVTITDNLVNHDYFKDDPDATDERSVLFQLSFNFIGWLTMLYDPVNEPEPSYLQIYRSYYSSAGVKSPLKAKSFGRDIQDFENTQQPLYTLLASFGNLIPASITGRRNDIAPPSEWIVLPFICYHTLRKVCRIEIVWVDTISAHLEFDSAEKILKIFRFPSFARLHYANKRRTLLTRLFEDNARDSGEILSDPLTIVQFFRDMLLTYRLIFGQDKNSWQLFNKETQGLSRGKKSSILRLKDSDPLLEILCGKSYDAPEAERLYEDIGADLVQPYYTANSHPFFADKLLRLQAYVKEQHPHNLKTLWYDHRDKANWWQFWAVLFIGGGTIVLSLLSLIFQIWQVALTIQQVESSATVVTTIS